MERTSQVDNFWSEKARDTISYLECMKCHIKLSVNIPHQNELLERSMGHRHIFCAPQSSDMDNDQNLNHPLPDPHLHLGNGQFMLPVENVAVGGVNNLSCFNMPPRSDGIPFSNLSSEASNYRAANTGISHDRYLHSSAGSSSQAPPQYIQYGQPCFNHFFVGNVNSPVNSQVNYGRVPFKRKAPTFSMAFNNGSTGGYYSAGSSSNFNVPSNHLQPKPMAGSQCWGRDYINMPPSSGNSHLFIPEEGSQRNVRTRHTYVHHLEINPPGAHQYNCLPQHAPLANVSGPSVAGQWNHTSTASESHRRIAYSGSNLMNTSISNRNLSTPLPNHHTPSTRGPSLGRSGYGQRTTYRATPSYRPVGFAATLEDRRRPGWEAVAPSRHSRPLSIVGRGSDRIGRVRTMYDRFQSFSPGDHARNRWASEGTLYGSGNYFDLHREDRLDIDNMSYEELLALEERIGHVNTGLTEDRISKCLKEVTHCSDQIQDGEEESCIICLEEYKDKDTIGGLKCGHEFHSSCIKKWLLIKNVCPICKASAVDASIEEK